MNKKISISRDGLNYEKKNINLLEDSIEDYANTQLNSIAELMLNLRVKFPLNHLVTIYNEYNKFSRDKWKNDMINLKKDIDNQNNNVKIDDVIALLLGAKKHVLPQHKSSYLALRAVVFEHCRLEDPNTI